LPNVEFETRFVNQTNVHPGRGLIAKRPGFPPFSEFDFGLLDLFRIEAGVGFNLLHDFPG
jgi:hypothetical protein